MKVARNRSLIGLVSWRIVAFTMLAMMLELGIIMIQYWSDESELGRFLIGQETETLAEGIRVEDGKLSFVMTKALRHRYTLHQAEEQVGKIYVRVRTAEGEVLFSNCEEMCLKHFLPIEINPPTFWQQEIQPGKPLSVAGGRSFDIGGQKVFVELAVLGDPHRFVNTVFFHELRDHLIIPMPLMFGLVAGATILSVWAALKPVVAAGKAADAIDPRGPIAHVDTDGMPREIANFANAVNRLLVRVADLIQAQKIFSTSIAHEIRTPVAIVRMELERIGDPRARKAETDLDALTHKLEQLTSLAKLDVVDPQSFRTVDLTTIANDSVASLAPFVFANGHTLEFADDGATPARAVSALVETTISNLVENAVKHTRKGTHIVVRTGPGPMLEVSDDGAGFGQLHDRVLDGGRIKSSDALGVGLKIVERIASIHDAHLSIDSAQGTTIRIAFPPAA